MSSYLGGNHKGEDSPSPSKVAIVGGGLAGLSTAFHLLQKAESIDITILDKSEVGTSGASSVAGGFLHPLSPTGKLVFMGLQALTSTNKLLGHAIQFEQNTVLRDEIFRVAVTTENVGELKNTARDLPELTQWLETMELPWETNGNILGALRLHSGCKVMHVPSYLQGLWLACSSMASESSSSSVRWMVESGLQSPSYDWNQRLVDFDTVVFSAGSGLFQEGPINEKFPIHLVHGQSVQMSVRYGDECDATAHAMLGGKYMSPMPDKGKVLIGATHEFQAEPWDEEKVKQELKDRSYSFASSIWDNSDIEHITHGIRVQSNRGKFGRIPIIGRLETEIHTNAWIFTGLSSRGLLYHGLFGDILTSMMLNSCIEEIEPEALGALEWWRNKVR